jgi:hypothetical protein
MCNRNKYWKSLNVEEIQKMIFYHARAVTHNAYDVLHENAVERAVALYANFWCHCRGEEFLGEISGMYTCSLYYKLKP